MGSGFLLSATCTAMSWAMLIPHCTSWHLVHMPHTRRVLGGPIRLTTGAEPWVEHAGTRQDKTTRICSNMLHTSCFFLFLKSRNVATCMELYFEQQNKVLATAR